MKRLVCNSFAKDCEVMKLIVPEKGFLEVPSNPKYYKCAQKVLGYFAIWRQNSQRE